MAKTNYSYEKRQQELKKQKKRQEKLQRKQEKKQLKGNDDIPESDPNHLDTENDGETRGESENL